MKWKLWIVFVAELVQHLGAGRARTQIWLLPQRREVKSQSCPMPREGKPPRSTFTLSQALSYARVHHTSTRRCNERTRPQMHMLNPGALRHQWSTSLTPESTKYAILITGPVYQREELSQSLTNPNSRMCASCKSSLISLRCCTLLYTSPSFSITGNALQNDAKMSKSVPSYCPIKCATSGVWTRRLCCAPIAQPPFPPLTDNLSCSNFSKNGRVFRFGAPVTPSFALEKS